MKQILIEGSIDADTTTRVRRELASANGQPIEVRIFSEGGDVIPGFTIHQMISEYRGVKSCVIDAAFSIASFIASAFPRCEMIENGYFMMHNPYWEGAESTTEKGFLESLRQKMVAGYSRRSGKPESAIVKLMQSETFMDATQAIAMGFADAILPASPRLSISAKYQTAIASMHSGVVSYAEFGGLRPAGFVSNYPVGLTRNERIERLVDRVIALAILEDKRR